MEPSNPQYNSQNDEISLKELILKLRDWYRYLLSKWLIILFTGVIGAAVGFYYVYVKKTVYTATSTFVLDEGDASGSVGRYAGIASMVGVDLGSSGGGIFEGDNLLELYKSRTMLTKSLLSEVEFNGKKKLLIEAYIDINNWVTKPELQKLNFLPTEKNVPLRVRDSIISVIVNDIRSNYLSVGKPDKNLGIIQVEVKGTNELFTKVLNEQIVKTINDFYIQTKTKKALENISILQYQTDSVQTILNRAIYKSAAIADATPNLNPTRQVLRAPVQRSQFNAEVNKAILTQLVQNLELAKISLRKETPLIQVIDTPILPLNKSKIGNLKGTLIGFFLFGFLAISVFTFKLIFKAIIKSE